MPARPRHAAVVLGNVGMTDDVDVLTWALDDPEPLVRAHAASPLQQVATRNHASDPR